MLQAVVSYMIAEGTLRLGFVSVNMPGYAEIRLGRHRKSVRGSAV